jgi:hypothetical protein
MAAVHTSLVSQVLQVLPGPLLSVLDAWSHRIALRRAQQRQQKWLRRQARPAEQPEPVRYHLKPWRD